MMCRCKILVSCQKTVFFALAVISAAALAVAFVSQYAYGLQPCELCIYQRIGFGIAIGLCVLGIALDRPSGIAGKVFMGLTALAFMGNTVVAFYHSGVERKWWKSFLEGCTIPEMKGNITDVLAQIEATPIARCDEIPWTDPLIGLSMANYNVMLCLALAIIALSSILSRRASSQSPERP